MRHALLVVIALAANAVVAKPAAREDYAWSWPIAADTKAGAVRVVLPPDVYARVAEPGLRDLAVYNAAGAEVPFGPIPATQAIATLTPPSRELPWFALPSSVQGSSASDTVHLTLARGADGIDRPPTVVVDQLQGTYERQWMVFLRVHRQGPGVGVAKHLSGFAKTPQDAHRVHRPFGCRADDTDIARRHSPGANQPLIADSDIGAW